MTPRGVITSAVAFRACTRVSVGPDRVIRYADSRCHRVIAKQSSSGSPALGPLVVAQLSHVFVQLSHALVILDQLSSAFAQLSQAPEGAGETDHYLEQVPVVAGRKGGINVLADKGLRDEQAYQDEDPHSDHRLRPFRLVHLTMRSRSEASARGNVGGCGRGVC